MGTPFTKVYSKYLRKITDYKLLEMSDQEVDYQMQDNLESAIAQCKALRVNAYSYSYNEEDNQIYFDHDLTPLEIEILAIGLVREWLEPQINNVLLTVQMVSGNEEKFFAQHNHLNGMMALAKRLELNQKKLISDYKLFHNSYLGTVEEIAEEEEIIEPSDEDNTNQNEGGNNNGD